MESVSRSSYCPVLDKWSMFYTGHVILLGEKQDRASYLCHTCGERHVFDLGVGVTDPAHAAEYIQRADVSDAIDYSWNNSLA